MAQIDSPAAAGGAALDELGQEADGTTHAINRVKQRQGRCSSLDLLLRFVAMMMLSYTGFIRLLTPKKKFHIPIVMSHTFELVSHNIPLLMLQVYSNNNDAIYIKPLYTLNLALSIASAADLLIECLLEQLLSTDSDFLLLNRKLLFIPDDLEEEALLTSDEETESESSEDDQGGKKPKVA